MRIIDSFKFIHEVDLYLSKTKKMKELKSTVKKIPILGSVAEFIFKKLNLNREFISSSDYWENRYKSGGNSGAGSYNVLAEYKAEIINDFVKERNVRTVIEFGCGDGNQLKYFNFKSYVGFDVSQTVISQCKELYNDDSNKRFEVVEDYNGEKADLVLSLDVIYHVIEDSAYFGYMEKLFSASSEYVMIYSSNEDDHENNDITPHVKHRKFTNWVEENASNFKIIEHLPNKYAYSGDNNTSSYADFYIFQMQN